MHLRKGDMTKSFSKLLGRRCWPLLVFLSLLSAPVHAAKLEPETLAAFANYLCEREKHLEQRVAGDEGFMWALESDERTRGLREGEIYIKPTNGKGETDIQGGLIHDCYDRLVPTRWPSSPKYSGCRWRCC